MGSYEGQRSVRVRQQVRLRAKVSMVRQKAKVAWPDGRQMSARSDGGQRSACQMAGEGRGVQTAEIRLVYCASFYLF